MAESQQILVRLTPEAEVPYQAGIMARLRGLLGPVWGTVALLPLYGNDNIIVGVVASIERMGRAKRGQFFSSAAIRQRLLNGIDGDDGAPSPSFRGLNADLAVIATLN